MSVELSMLCIDTLFPFHTSGWVIKTSLSFPSLEWHICFGILFFTARSKHNSHLNFHWILWVLRIWPVSGALVRINMKMFPISLKWQLTHEPVSQEVIGLQSFWMQVKFFWSQRVKQCNTKCPNHIHSQWDNTELMNGFYGLPFADWLERNDMDCWIQQS